MATGRWVQRAERWLVAAPLGMEGERITVVTKAGRALQVQLGTCAFEEPREGLYLVRDDAVSAHRRWERDTRVRLNRVMGRGLR